MALIRTIPEAKAALGRVLSNLSNDAVKPDFGAAENKYLIPYIGTTLYDAINGKLNADPVQALTDEEIAILPHLRRISVAYAYIDEIGTDAAKITDSGVRRMETQGMPSAYGWQFKELKESLQTRAADSIEILLRYLFSHSNDYPTWTASDEYKAISDLLIKTGTEFNSLYELWQPNRTFYGLIPLLKETQEEMITDSIGTDLVAYLAADVTEDEEKKIQRLVKKAVAYQTIYMACKQFPVRFDANGFSMINGGADSENPESAGRAQADIAMFTLKMNNARDLAEAYLTKAKKRCADYRADTGTHADFDTAYDAGPMAAYVDPSTISKGNETRKIFRF